MYDTIFLMSLDGKTLNEIVMTTERYFVCLRCAECCYRWAVSFSNGTKKPENQKCPYLIDITKKKRRWKQAFCKIYNERPEICKNFKICFATVCPIGLWKWLKLKKSEPQIELPKRVKNILRVLLKSK